MPDDVELQNFTSDCKSLACRSERIVRKEVDANEFHSYKNCFESVRDIVVANGESTDYKGRAGCFFSYGPAECLYAAEATGVYQTLNIVFCDEESNTQYKTAIIHGDDSVIFVPWNLPH